MSDGIDLRFRRSNQTFGTSLSFENDILSLLNNRGDVLSSVNIDLIKKEELPTANEDNLGVIYLYTGPDDEYKHGYFYECVENSGVYSWENIVVQDSYLKSETYNKTEVDTELAKKLNTDGSNTFTGVLKMRASVSFKGAVAPSWSGIGIYELKDDDSVSLMASMEKTDGFTPASNNTYNIGVNSRKWKDLYLAGKAYIPTINNGGDIAVPSVGGTMALTSDIAIGKNNITNCITEIPQDIKLELNNGTLTLKAGSKVYVPNGFESDGVTPKFDTIIISSDISATPTSGGTSTLFLYIDSTGENLHYRNVSTTDSGTSDPGLLATTYYNTSTNIITAHNSGGDKQVSLPVATIISTSNVITSIGKIFNGFGYIGSTVFALPGVKGLIPNGRNEDGSLKNTEVTILDVLTRTSNSLNIDLQIVLTGDVNPELQLAVGYKYDEDKNLIYYSDGISYPRILVGHCYSDSSYKVKNFAPKTAFHAVDYNDTDMLVNYQLPNSSNNYTWYRKYASGWVEQGGYVTISLTNNIADNHWIANYPIALNSSKIFYSVNAQTGWVYEISGGVEDVSATKMGGFYKVTGGTIPRNINIAWEVKGMIA